MLQTERLTNAVVVLPVGTCGPMPQQVNSVSSPSLGHEHAVVQVRGGAQLGEDADEDFVGQPVDGRPARVVDLHVLEIGDAERGLGVVGTEEEVGLFVVGWGGRVCGGRGPRVLSPRASSTRRYCSHGDVVGWAGRRPLRVGLKDSCKGELVVVVVMTVLLGFLGAIDRASAREVS